MAGYYVKTLEAAKIKLINKKSTYFLYFPVLFNAA